MHQSFVTTAPPLHLRVIAGTTTFHHNSPAKSPVLWGPAESHSPALYKSKFRGVYLCNITSPALTRYCGGTQKVIAPHISPAIPVGGGGGGAGAAVTNDWCINWVKFVVCFGLVVCLIILWSKLLFSCCCLVNILRLPVVSNIFSI